MDEPRRQENKIRLERGQCNSPAAVSQNQGFFLRDVLILLSSIFIRQTFFFFARMFRRIKPVSCYLLIMFSSNTCSFGEKLKFKSSISRNSQKMKNQGVMCLYQKNKNSAPLRTV